MNEGLLREALAARDRLLDAQHHTDSARADYHDAIRRLHSSGESTREIARRLGLSHQRVHQIVEATEPSATTTKKPSLLRRLAGEQECAVPPADAPRMQMLTKGQRLAGHAQQALLLAEDEARSLNHDHLGTEHILLGLLAARHSVAARILTHAGADREEVRAATERIVGRGPEEPAAGQLTLTPRAKKALSYARKEAKFEHSTHTRGEHLLFGILRERNAIATQVLTDLGVDPADLRHRIARAGRVCSFCARNGIDVDNLIAGPGVFICDGCTRDATRLATDPAPKTTNAALTVVPTHHHEASCNFCGKQRTDVDQLITGPGATICSECLALCREINAEEGTNATG